MEITRQFKFLLQSQIPKDLPPAAQPSAHTTKFPEVCLHLANQLNSITDELVLIRSLYTTPTAKTASKQQVPELPLYRLHLQRNEGKPAGMGGETLTVIGLVHQTAKQHFLSYLPMQWSTLIDTFVKESLAKVSDALVTMRSDMKGQREMLDNLYKIDSAPARNSRNQKSQPTTFIVTPDRGPVRRFVAELRELHRKEDLKSGRWRGLPLTVDGLPNWEKKPKDNNNNNDNTLDDTPTVDLNNPKIRAMIEDYLETQSQREASYWEILNASYQTLEHKEMVILSIETMVMKVGKLLIALEKERKSKQTQLNAQSSAMTTLTASGTGGNERGGGKAAQAISYSIAPTKARSKTTVRDQSGPGLGPGHGNDGSDDEKQYGDKHHLNEDNLDEFITRPHRRNSSSRKNPFAIGNGPGEIVKDNFDDFATSTSSRTDDFFSSLVENSLVDQGSDLRRGNTDKGKGKGGKRGGFDPMSEREEVDADFDTLANMYGLTASQLTAERDTLQSSLDHVELELATQVEMNLSEISSIINTFQTHIQQQSETIDSIYKDVDIVNHHIDTGNDQLDEALARGGWGAKFYMWMFIACGLVLLFFDFILN